MYKIYRYIDIDINVNIDIDIIVNTINIVLMRYI